MRHFAASHPDRTEALLHNAFARMLRTDDYPEGWPAADYERFLATFEEAWLSGTGIERRNPGLADNPRYREWFARDVGLAASPWMSRRLAELNAGIDVRPLLAGIRDPTLVICRAEDVWLSPENCRYLVPQIPGARSSCPASTTTLGRGHRARARDLRRRPVKPVWSCGGLIAGVEGGRTQPPSWIGGHRGPRDRTVVRS